MKTKLLLLLLFICLPIVAQTNLVPNGDFENWSSSSQPNNWYRYFNGEASQSSTAQKGSSSTKMKTTTASLNYINSEYFPVVMGKTYKITLFHKLVSGTFTTIDLRLYHKPGTFKEEVVKKTDAVFSSTEWRKIELDFTANVSENIEVDIYTYGDLNSEILVDNVSFVEVTSTTPLYTLIPDVNFENKLIALGYDSGIADGKVLTSQIANRTQLYISQSAISDLTGIQDFVNLTILDCKNNNLTTLDLSKNVLLEKLTCSDNKLTTVNLSKNLKLTELYCYNNKLTTINLLENVALKNLYCYSNEIVTLDVFQNKALRNINCSYNSITALDVSNHPNLYQLNCYSNSILSLDVSKSVLLNSLECNFNNIAALNLSNNINLVELTCNGNKLTSLDLSTNTLLKKVNCGSNDIVVFSLPNSLSLTEIQCDQNEIVNLDVTSLPNLQNLWVGFNNLISLNVTQNQALKSLMCQSNKLRTINVSQNSVLNNFYCHSNQLTEINLKNGNNTLITNANISLNQNPNLTCIQVDDVTFSNTNWSTKKDATAVFSTKCNLGLESSIFSKVSVYPNPTKGAVTILNVALEKVTVYNSLGQLVKTVTLDVVNSNNTINLSGLAKGVYYVYLINQDAVTAKKIIIE